MRKVIQATTFASALALASAPALAIDTNMGIDAAPNVGDTGLSADTTTGVTMDAPPVGAETQVQTQTEAVPPAAETLPAPATAETPPPAAETGVGISADALIGVPVVSSDGTVLGTVSEVQPGPNGEALLVTSVSQDLGLDTPNVRISSEAATSLDQQVQLAATTAEFTAAIQAQLQGGANVQ